MLSMALALIVQESPRYMVHACDDNMIWWQIVANTLNGRWAA